MRSFAMCCCVIVLAGCAKPEQQAAKDSATASLAAGATAAPISLATVAGKWAMRTMAATSDSVLVSYEMVAAGDPSGWTFNFPNRAPVPIRVLATQGDSIVTEAGPYESVLRKGIQVSTHSVMRLQDGKLVGTTVAHYSGGGPDSVLNLRTEGTRAP
jgi:hypothetical protein